MKPAGGHAVFIDAKRWLPQLDPLHFPAHVVACKLYEIGGIRSCEIGSVMFGRQPDGFEKPAAMELVRLAFPRRTYTQSHTDYVVEAFSELLTEIDTLTGLRIVKEPKAMRHFTSHFAPT